jgi:hypothetical protein
MILVNSSRFAFRGIINMPKTHNRDYFYKYTTSDSAKLILKNKTFKYSSGKELNDPRDLNLHINTPTTLVF